MRIFLDACVLYPAAVREILRAYAQAGGFTPLWSERVLEEWVWAADEKGLPPVGGEAAMWRYEFAAGEVAGFEHREMLFELPDPADAHVAAAALHGGAGSIITFNLRDFPAKRLRPFDLRAVHPDEFLRCAWRDDRARLAEALSPVAASVRERGTSFRAFLKRATLPKLGKAWERAVDGSG